MTLSCLFIVSAMTWMITVPYWPLLALIASYIAVGCLGAGTICTMLIMGGFSMWKYKYPYVICPPKARSKCMDEYDNRLLERVGTVQDQWNNM